MNLRSKVWCVFIGGYDGTALHSIHRDMEAADIMADIVRDKLPPLSGDEVWVDEWEVQ